MINLFISTATNRIIVSIIKNNDILFSYNEVENDSLSEKIMPIIEQAFIETDLRYQDVNKIYVVNGPGSFTGIRIGVTFAKTMSYCLNIPIEVISTLELLATTNVSTKYIMPIIDARRGYVFGGIYDNELNNIVNDKHILLEELLKNNYDYTIVTDDFNYKKPNIDLIKIINKHKDNKLNCHKVNPNYLKLTEAEENLIERNN